MEPGQLQSPHNSDVRAIMSTETDDTSPIRKGLNLLGIKLKWKPLSYTRNYGLSATSRIIFNYFVSSEVSSSTQMHSSDFLVVRI